MLFNSYEFMLVFLPAYLAGAWIIGRFVVGIAGLIVFSIAASLIFYAWWDWRTLPVLLVSIMINYGVALTLRSRWRALAFSAGIICNLAVLFFFKYAIFVGNDIIGVPGFWFGLQTIILPLGVSFFTFHQISYLADVYTGRTRSGDFARYVLFITFFPHLIAGPIVRYSEVSQQFSARRFQVKCDNLAVGLTIFAIGLCKKTLLADHFASISNDVFGAASQGEPLSALAAWGGAFAFSFQIYFDFSGYSDMAMGLARMIGVRFPENFRSPYKAASFIDFWRRWHMTLSRFLRDYLYKPLGGNRVGFPRQIVNLILVMFLGGLWHGAGWTFIVWGLIHGVALAFNHALVTAQRKGHMAALGSSLPARVLGWIIVQLTVLVAWIMFRSDSLTTAAHMLQAMLGQDGLLAVTAPAAVAALADVEASAAVVTHTHGMLQVILLSVGAMIVLLCPTTVQIMRRYDPAIEGDQPKPHLLTWLEWRMTPVWAVTTACVFAAGILGLSRVNEFIYFQF